MSCRALKVNRCQLALGQAKRFILFFSIPLDNEMDGESLEALLSTDRGLDSLKDLIPKLGVRLRIYKRLKEFCVHASNQVQAGAQAQVTLVSNFDIVASNK